MDRFALALSPSGRVRLESTAPDAAPIAPAAAARIERAFERGWAHGVLHLGAAEVQTALPPSAAWFRELAQRLVTALCATPEDANEAELPPLAVSDEALAELGAAAPPFVGSELVTPELLRGIWREVEAALRAEVAAESGSVRGWLAKQHAVWHRVGRVVLHLAENKRDGALPFAFLATYTAHVSRQGALEYVPLGRAVEASAGKKDRRALLALLEPLQRASERSELLRELVASGDVFHALAWDAREAYAFLQQIPVLEESGVVVRVPDWWKNRRPPRPKVNVTIGGKKPGGLGAESLVAFDVSVALGGKTLRPEDWARVERGTSGLALIRGHWVEIDRDRLEATLARWQHAESAARTGVSFHEAMRLLSGAAATDTSSSDDDGWSDVRAGAWLGKTLERLETPEQTRAVEPGTALCATLRPYQKIGVRWLWFLDELGLGGCLADDMGLGKTVQVIGLLVLKKERARSVKALLVVPASLLANWKSELERFAPSLSALCVHPSQRSNDAESVEVLAERADIVLTTYGMLARQAWLREREWSVAVLDEAQTIKNPAAKQTRAVKQLRARFRLVLTGTPVENRLGDLWSIFDFACPGLLGSAKEFGTLAKRLERSEHADFSPLRKLIRPYLLRRLKTDKHVIADLPDKTEVVAYCSLTKPQAVLYQQAVDDLARELAAAEGMKRRGVILATMMRLKQICNHPAHWLRHGGWNEAESGKLARVRELCEPIAARQERVLVFTQFREATAPLAAFLGELFGREGLVLHGATSVAKRKALVDAFQREDGPPFFVLSLKAGGTGLNLTAASHVIHFDRWWNPAVEAQATDRAFRIGQKRNVLVHKLVCRGTVEERIDRMIETKRALGDAVLAAGGEALLTELPNDEVLRLVALDLTSALGDAAADTSRARGTRYPPTRMARYFRPSDFDDTGVFPAYVSVTERRAQAAREAEARAKRGEKLEPVVSTGKQVASTFWGRAWCENLERYSDYANRLPRGRTYLKNGYVVDLRVAAGEVRALVQGTSCYEVKIRVRLLDRKRWASVVARSAGRVESLVELLRGRVSGEVMRIVTERKQGLFPSPNEIELSCSCPDGAAMCKHVAAALYGVGVRLDARPELLFTLRGADASELVATAATGGALVRPRKARANALEGTSLSELFGVPITEDAPASIQAPTRRAKSAQTKAGRAKARPRRPLG